MKNFMKLYLSVTMLSTILKDSIASSIAWSGAARFANNTKSNYSDDKTHLWLTSFSADIDNADMKPTVEQVLELVLTVPEKAQLSESEIKVFESTGMDLDSVTKVNEANYQRDLTRYNVIKKRVTSHEAHIAEQLTHALGLDTLGTYDDVLDESLEANLIEKVLTKLESRRGTLVARVISSAITPEEVEELTKINGFMDAKQAKSAENA